MRFLSLLLNIVLSDFLLECYSDSVYLDSFLNNPPANHDPAKRPKIIQRPLTSSLSSVLVWNLLVAVDAPSIKSSGCGSRPLRGLNALRSLGSTRSSATSRKRLRVFETFRAAVAEDSAWCGSREMCSRVGTETKSARAGSPAITMTLGTCGSSGKARAASALAREDSQKSGVNGWETQTTSFSEQISLHESA